MQLWFSWVLKEKKNIIGITLKTQTVAINWKTIVSKSLKGKIIEWRPNYSFIEWIG